MLKIQEFLEYTANLHDAVIVKIDWSISDKRLELTIEDIECNYEGLAEYRGPTAGRLLLDNVLIARFDFWSVDKKLQIYDFAISFSGNERFGFNISFLSTGRLEGTCSEATISPL